MADSSGLAEVLPVELIAARIADVQAKIGAAEAAAGRAPGSVTLMLAAKYQPVENVVAAIQTGVTTFGHNLVGQLVDAETGLASVSTGASRGAEAGAGIDLAHRTSVIGHVQSNKLSAAMDHAWRIDSVDSAKTLKRIARRQAARIAQGTASGPYPVLLQVNTSGAESQTGCTPEELLEIARVGADLAEIRVDGLMTIGANSPDEDAVRASFDTTVALLEEMRQIPGLEDATELSMGMTGDMAIAIAAGSTMVRVGTAVFGPRPAK